MWLSNVLRELLLRRSVRIGARSCAAFGVLAALVPSLGGQQRAGLSEWRSYGADLASTRYAPLNQVNASNFKDLEVAWRFKTDNLGPRPEFNLQSTPLVAKGILYSTGGTRRSVFALDAATGELKWVYGVNEGPRAAASTRPLSGRGLTYWTDGKEERILYVTIGYQMVALDAQTGRPIPSFGTAGMVDLKRESDQTMDLVTGDMALHAAPIVANDVIVIGAAHANGLTQKSRKTERGSVRGYDVRTGKRLWIFNTIPRPGQFGNETWLNDSWSYTGNTGAWAQMSADEELGLVYVPVEMPTNDGYGGHRHGANVFANSLVALDIKTGARRWHFQTIHHDLWDWDLPCAPILADLTVDGRPIKAVIQASKQGFIYVFDRVTGAPVWPIEERAVPKGDVPGEWYSSTQPFPTKPPAFVPQGLGTDDLLDFTPALREEALELASKYKIGPLFTPPVVSRWNGPRGTLMFPSAIGGANWPGASLDPTTNMLYVFANVGVYSMGLINDPKQSDMDFIQGVERAPSGSGDANSSGLTVQRLPLVKPPWATITAFDMNKGERIWQIAHGETPDDVRNNPALKGVQIARTGRQGRIGTLVTDTLVIAGEAGFFTTPSGARGAMLRAYDKATGAEVGEVFMPAPQTGTPMTFMLDGRQYLVVAISGGAYGGELLSFRLPDSGKTQ